MRTKLYLLALSTLLISCGNTSKSESQNKDETPVNGNIDTTKRNSLAPVDSNEPYDTQFTLISDKELGEFPYLTLPANYTFGYKEGIDESDIKNIDKEYFAANGELYPVEGKSFKVTIEKNRKVDKERFSSLAVQLSFDEAILKLGGVCLNRSIVYQEEKDRIKKFEGDNFFKYTSSVGSNSLNTLTYLIKTKEKEIWIQMWLLDDESGALAIVEKKI